MRVVVVTAITADRDTLKEHQNTEGAEFVAFCDRPRESRVWQVRPACDLFRDPVRNAKIHKILPHLYFPDHDYSLWIDGAFELADPAPLLIERYLGDCDVVFGCHPVHRSLDDEIEACLREVLEDPAPIREQAERMTARGAADSGPGFPLAGAILRRHTPAVAHFNAAWWALISRWSRRDQLSLLEAARTAELRWGCFPRSPALDRHPLQRKLGVPHFRWYPHGEGLALTPGPAAGAAADLDPPAWWVSRLRFVEAVSGQREAYALHLEGELAGRTRDLDAAERYVLDLQTELARRTRRAEEAERYAKSLRDELARLRREPRPR
jgi:hypothetical protein